jgi:hypothetical protein
MNTLKESLVESYTGIVFCVKEGKDTSILDPFISDIFNYLNTLCMQESVLDPLLAKLVAGLVGDVVALYGKIAINLVKAPFIERVKHVLLALPQKDYRDACEYMQKNIAKLG